MKVLFLVNPNAGGRANKTAVEIARGTFADAGSATKKKGQSCNNPIGFHSVNLLTHY
jgi:hypothetical protein